MKLHINYTENWEEIEGYFNEARDFFKPLGLEISSSYIPLEELPDSFFESHWSWSKLRLIKATSIKNSVIRALGKIKNPNADWYGIYIDKKKVNNVFDGIAGDGILEVYGKRTLIQKYGMNYNVYTLCHEILHLYEQKANMGNALHEHLSKGGTLEQFRDKLTPQKVEPVWKYKHFSPDERTGRYTSSQYGTCSMLREEIMDTVEAIREAIGKPVTISSGLRSADYNKSIGGATNSAHLRGYAIDIPVPNDSYRYELLKIIFQLGVPRVGIYKTFVHIDVDPSLPQNVTWYY